MTTPSCCKLVTFPAPPAPQARPRELCGAREAFRLLEEKGLSRERKLVLEVRRLVEYEP